MTRLGETLPSRDDVTSCAPVSTSNSHITKHQGFAEEQLDHQDATFPQYRPWAPSISDHEIRSIASASPSIDVLARGNEHTSREDSNSPPTVILRHAVPHPCRISYNTIQSLWKVPFLAVKFIAVRIKRPSYSSPKPLTTITVGLGLDDLEKGVFPHQLDRPVHGVETWNIRSPPSKPHPHLSESDVFHQRSKDFYGLYTTRIQRTSFIESIYSDDGTIRASSELLSPLSVVIMPEFTKSKHRPSHGSIQGDQCQESIAIFQPVENRNTDLKQRHENGYVPSHGRKPSLAQSIIQHLPQSPPTLHKYDFNGPPNPGSPVPGSLERTGDSGHWSEATSSLHSKVFTKNDARKMLRWEIWLYRIMFSALIAALNLSLLAVYLFTPEHHYLLAFLVFMKSKDLLSVFIGIGAILWNTICDAIRKPEEVSSKWILSLVCAYAETEAQIMKTVTSLIKQELGQHKHIICIILDGKPRNVLSHFTLLTHNMDRTYTTWKGVEGIVQVRAGYVESTPIILLQKVKNAGKKDSLILGHSLFNHVRYDAPIDMQLLRKDIYTDVLPDLTNMKKFQAFDYVYATDADSVIHRDCLKELANTLSRRPKAIAACGIILAELEGPEEWTIWHIFQQFQYTFGQYIRRRAESVWGRVTCLPGPVTMIAVRPEMARAISDYAAPVTNANLFHHQVQYQGTDRRLTYCMLSQGKHLETVLVPTALGETVVPATLHHYLSQRRRWAANAYFNNCMYTFGKQQHIITRLFGLIDVVRMSFVYYRVVNTILFIRSLAKSFHILKLTPTLILTKSPTIWFVLLVLFKQPVLRRRLHKLACGVFLNQIMSPFLSVINFSRVLLNMGNHTWGVTGVSSKK